MHTWGRSLTPNKNRHHRLVQNGLGGPHSPTWRCSNRGTSLWMSANSCPKRVFRTGLACSRCYRSPSKWWEQGNEITKTSLIMKKASQQGPHQTRDWAAIDKGLNLERDSLLCSRKSLTKISTLCFWRRKTEIAVGSCGFSFHSARPLKHQLNIAYGPKRNLESVLRVISPAPGRTSTGKPEAGLCCGPDAPEQLTEMTLEQSKQICAAASEDQRR